MNNSEESLILPMPAAKPAVADLPSTGLLEEIAEETEIVFSNKAEMMMMMTFIIKINTLLKSII